MEFISHCIKRNPNKIGMRSTAGLVIIFLVLSLLGWIYLTQASHVATTSRHNQDLEDDLADMRRANMELMVQIAEYESVDRLATRARDLGFECVSPDQADYIALTAPAYGTSQETDSSAQDHLVQAPGGQWTSGSDRQSDGDGQADFLWAQSALGGVKAQFIAWVRAESR